MAADRIPGGFGSKLRDARERRGVTVQQIAARTKISASALEALERNDISRLPGGIFSRAFVRSYAIEVGLDPEETIQEFIDQFPHDSVTAGHPTSQQVEDHEALESDRRIATALIRLIALSVPVAGIILYVGFSGRRQTPRAPAGRTAARTNGAAAPLESSPRDPSRPIATAAAIDRLTVGLTVTASCRISATADGQRVFERQFRPGEHEQVQADHEIVLTADDAAAVNVTINGTRTKPLGKAGDTVTWRVNASNLSDFLAAQ